MELLGREWDFEPVDEIIDWAGTGVGREGGSNGQGSDLDHDLKRNAHDFIHPSFTLLIYQRYLEEMQKPIEYKRENMFLPRTS